MKYDGLWPIQTRRYLSLVPKPSGNDSQWINMLIGPHGPHFPESIFWIVDDITQVLEQTDIVSILKEFKTIRWDEDPMIYFYAFELLMAPYTVGHLEVSLALEQTGIDYMKMAKAIQSTIEVQKSIDTCYGKIG